MSETYAAAVQLMCSRDQAIARLKEHFGDRLPRASMERLITRFSNVNRAVVECVSQKLEKAAECCQDCIGIEITVVTAVLELMAKAVARETQKIQADPTVEEVAHVLASAMEIVFASVEEKSKPTAPGGSS